MQDVLEGIFVVLISVVLKHNLMAHYTLLPCCLKVLGFVLVFLESSEPSCKYLQRRLEEADKTLGPTDDNAKEF